MELKMKFHKTTEWFKPISPGFQAGAYGKCQGNSLFYRKISITPAGVKQ